jgi:hypothetical protein
MVSTDEASVAPKASCGRLHQLLFQADGVSKKTREGTKKSPCKNRGISYIRRKQSNRFSCFHGQRTPWLNKGLDGFRGLVDFTGGFR